MELRYYFNGNGDEVPETSRTYIEEKLEKLQKFLRGRVTVAEVEIEKDKKGHFRVEVQARIPGSRYIADNIGHTIEEGFDLVFDELVNQINKNTKKIRTLRKRAEISIKKRFVIDEGARFRKSDIS
jgi:ribosomal subunit interface protein